MNPYAAGENKFKYRKDKPTPEPEEKNVVDLPILVLETGNTVRILSDSEKGLMNIVFDGEDINDAKAGDEDAIKRINDLLGFNFRDVRSLYLYTSFGVRYPEIDREVDGALHSGYLFTEPQDHNTLVAEVGNVFGSENADIPFSDAKYSQILKSFVGSVALYRISE